MDITTNKSWKYDLKKLESTSYEFKIVEHFFKTTSSIFPLFPGIFKKFQIWKVIEQNEKATADEKSNNLMLFHGTNQKGVTGILENGYKNSKEGKFGKGVYMTESSNTASSYSYWSMNYSFLNFLFSKSSHFIFVNEVLNSENLETILYEHLLDQIPFVHGQRKTPFSKYMHVLSSEITVENYKEDPTGRLYRNIAVDENSEYDEFIADAELVIPRYLISYEN